GNGSPKGDGPRRVVSRDQFAVLILKTDVLFFRIPAIPRCRLRAPRRSRRIGHCWSGITTKAADRYLFLIGNLLHADTRSKATQRFIGTQIRFSMMKRRRKYGPT